MKRFMKGCGLTAAVLAAAGVALGMTGRTIAGQSTIDQVLYDVTGGWFYVELGRWCGIHPWQAVDLGTDMLEQEREICWDEYAEEYASSWAERDPGWMERDSGWTDRYCPGTEIRELDIEMQGGSLVTAVSDDDRIYLDGSGSFQGYVDDGTLYISTTEFTGWDTSICLYVPEAYYFDEVEVDIRTGEVSFYGLAAGEVSLEAGAGGIYLEGVRVDETLSAKVGAGTINLYEMEAGELDVEVGMGELYAQGAVDGGVEAECAMGNVEIGLAGSENDYNYALKCALGNLQVGNYSSAGLSQERKIDNGAGKTVEVDCATGNVTIYFME